MLHKCREIRTKLRQILSLICLCPKHLLHTGSEGPLLFVEKRPKRDSWTCEMGPPQSF